MKKARRIQWIVYMVLLAAVPWDIIASQSTPVYWVSFDSKNNSPYSIDSPEEYLSVRAIERRSKQGIAITEEDLPVDPQYISELKNTGIQVMNTSKWFNGAMVVVPEEMNSDFHSNFNFIKGPPLLIKPGLTEKHNKLLNTKLDICGAEVDYHKMQNQLQMLGGIELHNTGFKGEGIRIAILDAGFMSVKDISSLKHVWKNNRVIAMRDFVSTNPSDFYTHTHGTVVFSILAGSEEDLFSGSAPNAEYVLIRTEDGSSEYLIEEYNWICGAEFADSIGADVINTSLGYSLFDDPAQNHTYADMDGASTPVSIAAQKAASKGMLIVTSAGNSGNNDWFYITAPADAKNIIAVGATDSTGNIAYFSSRGPSFDGRVKPDVSAQGYKTIAQNVNGEYIECNGTSCSAPVVSGLAACFWQAHPKLEVTDLVRKTIQGSSLYSAPNSELGYGIPDMIKSSVLLTPDSINIASDRTRLLLFPVPATDRLTMYFLGDYEWEQHEITINIYNVEGHLCHNKEYWISSNTSYLNLENISELSAGFYALYVHVMGNTYKSYFIKH